MLAPAAAPGADPLARARAAYAPFPGQVEFVLLPTVGLPAHLPAHLDVVLALHVLPTLSLIEAVRFLSALRDAGAATLIVDHYPAVTSNAGGDDGGRDDVRGDDGQMRTFELTLCARLHSVQILLRPRCSWALVMPRAGGSWAGRGV